MADQPSAEKEPWQRFTLLDVFLLQASFAIGLSLAVTLAPPATGWLFRALAAVVLGLTVAGPICLGTQWAFRGRRSGLSMGEWLGFTPAAFFAVGLLVAVVGPLFPLILLALVVWVLAQPLFALVALGALVGLFMGDRPEVKCTWTDAFGSSVCILFCLALCAGVGTVMVISW
jgi:hypothetical protein